MQDCAAYFRATGRRVTFEYTLMSGTNDAPEQVSKHHITVVKK
jgi:23S rRNA (adenine2503-C2)-methyltransferase